MSETATPDRVERPEDWSLRPWILAGLLGVAGLFVFLFSDDAETMPWNMAATAFVFFGAFAAAFTIDRDDFGAPSIYALGVAVIMGGIAWRVTEAADRYGDTGFWFAAGLLAIILSLPLFKAGFHKYRWATSYKATHYYVWSDAICGIAALAFTGLSWALIVIISELFQVIQIDVLKHLLDEAWFGWMFSGIAFGAALGVLRNQLKIIGTLQSVVLLVLSLLAVPLAVALALFLLAVVLSGIDVLWDATKSATPLLLAIAVGCFVLTNAVVRDDDADASGSRILRVAGFILAVGILPLAIMAALSMGTRIAQHGLSPERIWALIAIAVAVAYGVGYFVSAIRGRKDGWRAMLRQSNLHLAVMTCVIAFLLAMPILNFGAISTSNQLSRLASGTVSAEDFDYSALRWDFGDAGREALAELAKSKNTQVSEGAQAAQAMESRYDRYVGNDREEIADKAKINVEDEAIRIATRTYIMEDNYSCKNGCRVTEIGTVKAGPLLILMGSGDPEFLVYDRASGKVSEHWIRHGTLNDERRFNVVEAKEGAAIELRPFTGRQLYVDGKPASAPFRD